MHMLRPRSTSWSGFSADWRTHQMHDAIRSMVDRYDCRSREDSVSALREILQNLALLGLWRSKFFEHAALCDVL